MDVGDIAWPEDVEFDDDADVPSRESSAEEALDTASRIDQAGDWREAISAYREIADRWLEHSTYASNCIAAIQGKLGAANGD